MIPLANTTVQVSRSVEATDTDRYAPNPPAPIVVTAALRAVVTLANVTTQLGGGLREDYDATMICDPSDVQPDDIITDARTALVWGVLSVTPSVGFGLDHLVARLRTVTGAT